MLIRTHCHSLITCQYSIRNRSALMKIMMISFGDDDDDDNNNISYIVS